MSEDIYKKLLVPFAKRGGGRPEMIDLPEFYALIKALFTPEEAEVASVQPPGFTNYATAAEIAVKMEKNEDEVREILEAMADKGTCISNVVDEIRQYSGPGLELIRNFQFMRGTTTARDKKLARLYNEFNQARRARTGPITYAMPVWRSIPIEKTIHVESVIYSYDQVSHFIENYEPLSVSSCYCRQAAKLLDPGDTCDAPQEACMTLGEGATGLIERGISREITKEEAYDILDASEKAGLIHTSNNIQDIFCICNCCSCHCMWIEYALNQAKPREAWSVSTRPRIDFKLCEDCRSDRICIERCPTDALSLSADNSMRLDMDRCLGCGLCAIDCMDNAVVMRARPDAPTPPLDFAAFEVEMREAWMKRLAEQGSP